MSTREQLGRSPADPSARLTDRIIDVATTLFLGVGYEKTSIETIVAKAGVSKRAFYARFGSKADLFAGVVIRLAEFHFPCMDAIASSTGPVERQLERVAAEILRITGKPEAIALDRIVTAEVGRFPELGRILIDFAASRTMGAVCKILDQAVARGEIGPLDTRFAAQYFLQATVAGPRRMIVLGLEDNRVTGKKLETLRRAIRLFLDGARGTPHGARHASRRPPSRS
ncbi:TetR/AcrR family transcriptional regulator [Rhodoplanes sp. TEM]|uniref:TetR/AcrR family transcriptional regulator n=1 Tax=Rhodoplanes tepidamans TaxID=200616 RepID=A0ABT5J8S7_RHOTP|nr:MULTISPECIES: TetR/AcrR family transcriptional regulator [Rhodoplanes]MDC7786061.1 TetR/AcrR family transcriptional regulator [Rhodoplanes tepidamans]MDC7983798.1 TetR/AcrR family transcriptional regulator [Rhodoplanes sp. TEM]MDQ0354904.1 AcrR family transcriptional regulator [Rhodoplanes tepidamans]